MPKLSFDRRVPFSPEQMLALVADLEAYPEFVPNCADMQVKPDRGQAGEVCLARMSIRFGPISQAYTSRVEVDREAKTIRAHAIDGPFSHLDSEWRFVAEEEGTHVLFNIDFGIKNPFIAAAAEPAFAVKQAEILDAFMNEAWGRYG